MFYRAPFKPKEKKPLLAFSRRPRAIFEALGGFGRQFLLRILGDVFPIALAQNITPQCLTLKATGRRAVTILFYIFLNQQ
jgi:hypothetical protein